MIINPNLYSGTQNVDITSNGSYANYGFILKYNIDQLITNKRYTLSCVAEQSKNGSGYIELATLDLDDGARQRKVCKIDNRISYTFYYDELKTKGLLIYTDKIGETKNVDAIFKNIKVEEGDKATMYIPNINKVKASDKAIFPSGGGTAKSIHCRHGLGVSL